MKIVSWTRFGAIAALVIACTLAAASAVHAAPPDGWITARVKSALLTARGVPGMPIQVDTYHGQVTLAGEVDSPEQRDRAEQVARRIDGVQDVRNLIQVVPHGMRHEARVEDHALQRQVSDALRSDPDLRQAGIHVKSVNRGVVLLSGRGTASEAARALEVARRTPGVDRVESEIQPTDREGNPDESGRGNGEGYDHGRSSRNGDYHPDRWGDNVGRESGRERNYDRGDNANEGRRNPASDAWLTTQVKVRLATDRRFREGRVSVDSWHGDVTLFGEVPSAAVADQAVREAGSVRGVRSVVNELQVVPGGARERGPRDGDIENAVRTSIDDARMPGAHVHVRVVRGMVQLTGTVRDDHEWREAEGIARRVDGVTSVRNDLHEEGR